MSGQIEKHCYRLLRSEAPNDRCILGECHMTNAEADHFNEIIANKDQSARWYKVES